MSKKEEMVAIPIASFFKGLSATADIFIGLSDQKFVLLIKEGSIIDFEQLKKYDKQDIKELYVRKDDYPKMMQKQISVAGVVINNQEIPAAAKTTVLNRIAESVFDEFQQLGFEKQAVLDAQEITKSVVNLVNTKPDLFNLLDSLNKISEEVFRHSMSVSFVSTLVGGAMEWTKRETLEKLGIGGLFHDIGKKEMNPEIIKKPRTDMTYEELKEYESHPYRGMQLLSALEILPEDVLSMVYEHHENSIGQGYPRRLWDMKINPLAKVVSLSNMFCELTVGSVNCKTPKSPQEAIRHIEGVLGQPYNKQALKALKSLFDIK